MYKKYLYTYLLKKHIHQLMMLQNHPIKPTTPKMHHKRTLQPSAGRCARPLALVLAKRCGKGTGEGVAFMVKEND